MEKMTIVVHHNANTLALMSTILELRGYTTFWFIAAVWRAPLTRHDVYNQPVLYTMAPVPVIMSLIDSLMQP